MTYREAVRKLIKHGVRFRQGKKHYLFYPAGGGMVAVPDKAKEMSKQHTMLVRKVLNGTNPSRTSDRRG